MALEVIIGAPFSGKSQAARDLVREREEAGELGLVVVDFSAIFAALIPGILSSYRDEAVSETGAPSLVAGLFAAAVARAHSRNMSGYVLLNSPRRAINTAAQVGARELLEMDVGIDTVVERVDAHLSDIRRAVPRARTAAATARCANAAAAFYREVPDAYEAIPRRKVRRQGRRYVTADSRERGFDEAAFLRGLTPRGHDVRADLLAEGQAATPAAIFRRLLQERLS